MPEAPTEKSEKVEHNGTCKKPRLKPTENPWYLLATLYGQPTRDDTKLETRNRVAWNRYMASKLSEESRATLIAQGRHPAEELMPLSEQDLRAIETIFTARNSPEVINTLSGLEPKEIDFSDLEF